MSSYNNWDSEEEAQKWVSGVIAGLLSFGALAAKMSEFEVDKTVDKPEIEAPDITVPSVPMNLGKGFGFSGLTPDKLISIIFSLLMIIFIILSTIKGVKINRDKIVEDLLKGKFSFTLVVNGPTTFYLRGELPYAVTEDYPLSAARLGYVKYIPGFSANVLDDDGQYFWAKETGSHLNAYFFPSPTDNMIISAGSVTPTPPTVPVDAGDYDIQIGAFGDTETTHAWMTDFQPEEYGTENYGEFEFATKKWYSNSLNGAFLLRFYETHYNTLSESDRNNRHVSYMLPVTGIDIEYRPLRKRTETSTNIGLFKKIQIESNQGYILIENSNYPYGGEDCQVSFDLNYSVLQLAATTDNDRDRTLYFCGIHNDYTVENGTTINGCGVSIRYNGELMLAPTIQRKLAFDCGPVSADDFVFTETTANGYEGSVKGVHFGLVSRIEGAVDSNTSAYFTSVYNGMSYYGEGFSAINGWFCLTKEATGEYDLNEWTAYFTLGYTTVTSAIGERRNPVHKMMFKGLTKDGNVYKTNEIRCFFYDDKGNEKMWRLKTQYNSQFIPLALELAYPIPQNSFRTTEWFYPKKFSLNNNIISISELDYVSSTIYDVVDGEVDYSSEKPLETNSMAIFNARPKTSYEEQKANDYIRAAHVKGSATLEIEYAVEKVDTNPHTDFNISSPAEVSVEVPDCYTDPPPRYSEGLDKARMELRCDEMYLIQIFGTDYMNLKTNDMTFAESYVPDCECGKTDRYFERY